MTQVWNAFPAQLDALTEAKISVLRSKGANQNPALLHDLTAATNASDYTNLVRVRCVGVVIQTLLNRAHKYIGQSSLDGLTLVSMQTQLTQDLVGLQTRGYCTPPECEDLRNNGIARRKERPSLLKTDATDRVSRWGL
jgi:hypothetical protein